MSVIVWVAADDCDAPHGLDMDSAHDADKVMALARAFSLHGFDKRRPALVGYPLNGRIQLLSGTHRHRAATLTGTLLPVVLWLRSTVEAHWGEDAWRRVMEDIPVTELETWTREDVEQRYELAQKAFRE